MERTTPRWKLATIQELAQDGRLQATPGAQAEAHALGIDLDGMRALVLSLNKADFHKSLTLPPDHSQWHSIYLPTTRLGLLHLELSVSHEVLIVALKRANMAALALSTHGQVPVGAMGNRP